MKKVILPYILVFFCLAGKVTIGQTITDIHNTTIQPYKQEQTQWCWAGCTRMVDYSYSTTTPPSQCTIVNKANAQCTVGSCCSTLNGSRKTACSNPSSSNYPNNMGSCNGSLSWLINYYAASNTFASGAKTYSTVSSNLTNRKQMVARWGWTSGGGHFVVIYGCYQFNYVGQVSYANPASGSKVTESISYFTSNSSRTWTHTITMNSGTVRKVRAPETAAIENEASLIKFFPNPSNGLLYIERMGGDDSDVRVELYNSIGQKLTDITLTAEQQSFGKDLKSEYGSGIYYLQVINNGERSSEKIVIQ